jgi:adenosylhomocysteine nucleosidase
MTAIVAAMPEELAPLRARLTDLRRFPCGPAEIVTARLGRVPVVLAVTGDGERNARQGMAALLAAVAIERLVVIGVAGALSRELREETLVAATEVARERGGAGLRADQALLEMALRCAAARAAVVVSAERIADTPAEKRRLLEAAGAGSTPVVVDLESASYVAAAVEATIPWLVLRAVSDTADQALPALLNRSRDDGGAVRRGSVLRGLLGDPGALMVLLSLRRRVGRCAEVLCRAVQSVLLAGPGAGLPAVGGQAASPGGGV